MSLVQTKYVVKLTAQPYFYFPFVSTSNLRKNVTASYRYLQNHPRLYSVLGCRAKPRAEGGEDSAADKDVSSRRMYDTNLVNPSNLSRVTAGVAQFP